MDIIKESEWLLREKYGGEKCEAFFADLSRLESGEPLAYIIGHIPFLHTTIYLDLPERQTVSRPLIPRPETEFWVEKTIATIDENANVSVLDLCAGSGCIGVAVLKALPKARVDFAEIDPRHHPIIQKNILENAIDPVRTQIFGGNLFEHITEQYDYILTNPPYIDPAHDQSDASVREYEPHQALYGGKDGLEIITEILKRAPHHLTPGGTLVIEHEPAQASYIADHARTCGFEHTTHPDQYGVLRYTVLTRTKT